ncbi:MAG: sugar nucleotide-binding protein [Acidobacteria bacterium]|nr:sugar nucleotide-binding protein [Acidobacteriota bacterium]
MMSKLTGRSIRVVILGATGMLGSAVLDVLRSPSFGDLDLKIKATTRSGAQAEQWHSVEVVPFDAGGNTVEDLCKILSDCDWAINCIGLIKHHIKDDNRALTERAVRVNALFPHLLAEASQRTGCRILQIATDCVYSGGKGGYVESDVHDAGDVYGQTKSMGEVHAPNVHHLRCSIIGPEAQGGVSLLAWLLGQPEGARIQGYTNHHWNGLTTLQFAKICGGIIRQDLALPHLCHIIPSNVLHKGSLLQSLARTFGREDIQIDLRPAPLGVDRSLGTLNPELNQRLWAACGYTEPLSLDGMIDELSDWVRTGRGLSQ